MLTKAKIEQAINKRKSKWDLANQTLYDLCKKYKEHKNYDEIIAKIWAIGRSYSAAIERGRNDDDSQGFDFYPDRVAPCIRKEEIDKWLKTIEGFKHIDCNNLESILKVHYKVSELFGKINGRELKDGKKPILRSLASKYLHFHFPKLFFIYDLRSSTAVKALREDLGITKRCKNNISGVDNEYRIFSQYCLQVRSHIEPIIGRELNPRDLDYLLLEYENLK